MNFIFWQGVISIHQSAFIRALAENHNVTLVVEKRISDSRKKQGWVVPDMGKAHVIENPDIVTVNNFINRHDYHFVFSGFEPFPLAKRVMDQLVKRGEKVSLLLEPFNWRGFKGLLRRIKYMILAAEYRQNIYRLFVTGIKAEEYYRKCGFHADTISQWGYFTEIPAIGSNADINIEYNIIFVGSLDNNKNITLLVNEIGKYYPKVNLTVIGNGPLYNSLHSLDFGNIKLMDNQPNGVVNEQISKSDLLILPSKYDGWGAVVNEALMVGTPVLASENCGSSILLDGEVRGECFKFREFHRVLNKWVNKGKTSEETRKAISDWAKNNISGQVVAKYFADAMSTSLVSAPWLKHNN